MGLQRIDKTHAESPNGLLQDSDSVEDTSVLEVAPLSIIRQTLYCETREKGSAAILTPDSFFGWGTSRQRHISTKKISSAIISLYFSKSQLRHIFPPNSAALDRDCQRTIPTDERRNHFPTHSHTVISSFSFFGPLILIVVMAVLVDSYFKLSFIWGDWTIRHQSEFGNSNHSGSCMPMHGN